MTHCQQLGFDGLLHDAHKQNIKRKQEQAWSHLPSTMDDAIAYMRSEILPQHHNAMMALDFETAIAWREEAHLLASKLNGGHCGIIAGPDAPGCILDERSRSADGNVPIWGQSGTFTLSLATMRCSVDVDGMFGIGGKFMQWTSFSVKAVDWDRRFLSSTGYRSFLGYYLETDEPLSVDDFVRHILEGYIKDAFKSRSDMPIPKRLGS
ncbi:MAG TPA: hypothetical protein EYG02_10505 [Henriciella marina]|uniref:hypothetical protein n=1 Tax=Henriciella sp. TaxID=1968823 RepID=UPI001799495F|nr:hypothetical protein [Henriciella sp.]HIG21753.1 hypothetical protein [Henriciella sp.]HIK65443.1 hypothetical protein [Henriciella marina]